MDRQAIFKKISRVLIPIEISFIVASTIFAGATFYFAFNEYTKTHEVEMKQFNKSLAVNLIIIAVFSILLATFLVFGSEYRNKVKKTIILSIAVFMVIPLSILYQCSIYQYKYFPMIFFGSAILTIISKILSMVPNGIRAKAKQLLRLKN